MVDPENSGENGLISLGGDFEDKDQIFWSMYYVIFDLISDVFHDVAVC